MSVENLSLGVTYAITSQNSSLHFIGELISTMSYRQAKLEAFDLNALAINEKVSIPDDDFEAYFNGKTFYKFLDTSGDNAVIYVLWDDVLPTKVDKLYTNYEVKFTVQLRDESTSIDSIINSIEAMSDDDVDGEGYVITNTGSEVVDPFSETKAAEDDRAMIESVARIFAGINRTKIEQLIAVLNSFDPNVFDANALSSVEADLAKANENVNSIIEGS